MGKESVNWISWGTKSIKITEHKTTVSTQNGQLPVQFHAFRDFFIYPVMIDMSNPFYVARWMFFFKVQTVTFRELYSRGCSSLGFNRSRFQNIWTRHRHVSTVWRSVYIQPLKIHPPYILTTKQDERVLCVWTVSPAFKISATYGFALALLAAWVCEYIARVSLLARLLWERIVKGCFVHSDKVQSGPFF